MAEALARLHGQAVTADAPEPVAVRAHDEVDVGRLQHLPQAEVTRALVRGVLAAREDLGILRVAGEEVHVPRDLHEVAEEGAGELVAPGLGLHRGRELQQVVGRGVGEAREEVDHVALAHRVAEQAAGRAELPRRGRHLGGVERGGGVAPRGAQAPRVLAVATAQPGAEGPAHGPAVIGGHGQHRRPRLDPLARRTRGDLVGDHPVVQPDLPQMRDVGLQEIVHLPAPDLRREGLRLGPAVRGHLALFGVRARPPGVGRPPHLEPHAQQEVRLGVGLEEPGEARFHEAEIPPGVAPRPRSRELVHGDHVHRVEVHARGRVPPHDGLRGDEAVGVALVADEVQRCVHGLPVEEQGGRSVVHPDVGVHAVSSDARGALTSRAAACYTARR